MRGLLPADAFASDAGIVTGAVDVDMVDGLFRLCVDHSHNARCPIKTIVSVNVSGFDLWYWVVGF